MSIFLEIHIFGAVIGMLSGTLAILVRKGGGVHGAAGTVFLSAMSAMSLAAIYIAAFLRFEAVNIIAGSLTFYLVMTAWRAARNRAGTTGVFDYAALAVIASVASGAFIVAPQQTITPLRVAMFIFGTIAALFALGDIRMLKRGGVTGPKRIKRHLLRMGVAFLIALMSFYPTRARFFPPAVNKSGVLYLPHILLIVTTIVWLVRLSRQSRRHATEPTLPTFQPTLTNEVMS